MKKYLVVRMYETINPSVVEVCNDVNNANDLARIYANERGGEYKVATMEVEGE